MAEHGTVDLLRRAYDAFAAGDIETVLSLQAEDVVWHITGVGPLDGDYRGREGVMNFLGKLMEETGGTFRLDVHDLLGNDKHGAAIVTAQATRGGKTLDAGAVHVSHVRGGLTAEFWTAYTDPAGELDFWS